MKFPNQTSSGPIDAGNYSICIEMAFTPAETIRIMGVIDEVI